MEYETENEKCLKGKPCSWEELVAAPEPLEGVPVHQQPGEPRVLDQIMSFFAGTSQTKIGGKWPGKDRLYIVLCDGIKYTHEYKSICINLNL